MSWEKAKNLLLLGMFGPILALLPLGYYMGHEIPWLYIILSFVGAVTCFASLDSLIFLTKKLDFDSKWTTNYQRASYIILGVTLILVFLSISMELSAGTIAVLYTASLLLGTGAGHTFFCAGYIDLRPKNLREQQQEAER